MKLILSENPGTAKILAHVVGAREKIYSAAVTRLILSPSAGCLSAFLL